MEAEDEQLLDNVNTYLSETELYELSPIILSQLSMSNLQQIILPAKNHKNFRLSDENIGYLVEVIVNCGIPLTSLILKHHFISNDGADIITNLFNGSSNIALQELDLEGNNIDSNGAEIFSNCLSSPHCSLLSLTLSGNPIGGSGGVAVAEALKVINLLQYIH